MRDSQTDVKHIEPLIKSHRNVSSDFSIVTRRRVAIIFFELRFVRNFIQNL